MKASFSFTKVAVRDLDAMATYYGEVYGLTEAAKMQGEVIGLPIDEIMLGVDGANAGLILLHWVGQEPPAKGEVILGFTTTDLASLVVRAEAAGGTIREAPREVAETGGITVAFVADPEGHLAEVVQLPEG